MMNLIRSVITVIFSDWRMNTGIAASISLNLSIGEVVNQWLTVIISTMTIIISQQRSGTPGMELMRTARVEHFHFRNT